MKKPFVVLLIIIALPVFGALEVKRSNHASPFVAYAGRSTVGGGYCTCGDADCITEPGECGGNTNAGDAGDGGALLLLALAALALAMRLRS